MTLFQLLWQLRQQQVVLWIEQDRIRYRCPPGALTAELRTSIQQHREALLAYLQTPKPPDNCQTQCNPRNWVDTAPRNGRIRTTCKRCRRFIGYRPEDLN